MKEYSSGTMVLEISEYGKLIRTYSDNDRERFLKESNSIIQEHINRYIATNKIGELIVKNTQFHIFTY